MANLPVAFSTTISSISGNQLTLAAAAPAAPAWGDRFIWFTSSGAAQHETRKITAGYGTTTITLDEVPAGVATSDTIRISDTLSDLSVTGLTSTDDLDWACTEDLVFVDGAFLSMWGQSLIFESGFQYKVTGAGNNQTDSLWQMGYRNQEGFIEGGCSLRMPGIVQDRIRVGGSGSGVQPKWLGSQIYYRGNTSGTDDVFCYFVDVTRPNTMPQLEDCAFFISGGFRIGGTKGILRNNVFYSVTSQSIYPLTTRGVLADFSNNLVVDGRQAFYWAQSTSLGGSTTIRGHGAVDVQFDIRIASGSSNQILTSIDDKLNDTLVLSGSVGNHNIDRYVGLRPTVLNLDLTPRAGVTMYQENLDQGQTFTKTTDANGQTTESLVWRQRVGNGNGGGAGNFYNNVLRFVEYGRQVIQQTWDSRTPNEGTVFSQADPFTVSTEAAAGVLAAGITVNTGAKTVDFGGLVPQEAYDAISYWYIVTDGAARTKFYDYDGSTLSELDGWTFSNITVGATLTITGIPAGGILEIYDNDDTPADYQNRGTLLQVTNPTNGGAILFGHAKAGDDIIIVFIAAGFVENDIPFNLLNVDQSIDMNQFLQAEVNI